MPRQKFPSGARPAVLPSHVSFQQVVAIAEPPAGDDWLHELKHDGHRLAVIVDGHGGLRLLSRNGYGRNHLFEAPFAGLRELDRSMVLDGEITAPDGRGVTHLDDLTDAIRLRRPELLAFFAFDLRYLDGYDLRGCRLIDRKALLERVLGDVALPRVLYVAHVVGKGGWLFNRACELGCEGIVSKRATGTYGPGSSRDWVKTKHSEIGTFIVTAYVEPRPGKLGLLYLAEQGEDGILIPSGQVQFVVGRAVMDALLPLRVSESMGGAVNITPRARVVVKFFGRHKTGFIRDGVVQGIEIS